ncbi:MAG: heparinase II/III family protein [Verrucomicrobia bacterium]|nr:heparinase II/III family protein [Verrucomicrobiota bacterium]MCF7707954.1 heparinase II/III family protein [Verrucomicrobiota bacterium]
MSINNISYHGYRCLTVFTSVLLLSTGVMFGDDSFPKEEPDEFMRAVKVYDDDDSPLRRPVEDWAGARKKIEASGAWRDWTDARRRVVDNWMDKRRDHTNWIAGWWHDFVSSDDGSFLTWTPDEPGRYTLHSESDPEVELTDKLHRAWVFGFRSRHATKIVDAARLYKISGEQKYADWTIAQLDFYATNFNDWPVQPRQGRSRLMAQSLDEAVNLIRYVSAARLVDDHVPQAKKRMWIERLFRPESELLSESFQTIHNIACWQRAAQGMVALYAGNEQMLEAAVNGEYGIRNQLERGVTSDYLWFEQSLGYNSYVVRALYGFFEYAAMTGRITSMRHEMSVLENLMLAPIGMRFANGRLPNPADSTGGPASILGFSMPTATYRLFPTTLGLEKARSMKTWDTLIDPPWTPEKEAVLPDVKSRNMESSRMAILKSGRWQVFYHYGQLTSSHAQSEALNYEAYFGKTPITRDSGTVGYGSPMHRGYYTRGLNHNVPLVNGDGQHGWAPGRLVVFDADTVRVVAEQPEYQPHVSAERELQIEGGRLIDTVRVRVDERYEGTPDIGLVVHVQGTPRPEGDLKADPGLAQRIGNNSFSYWEDAKTGVFEDDFECIVDFNGARIRLRFETSGEFKLTHASAPDVPPRKRDVFYLEKPGRNTEFKTVWTPLSD